MTLMKQHTLSLREHRVLFSLRDPTQDRLRDKTTCKHPAFCVFNVLEDITFMPITFTIVQHEYLLCRE
jgi:hypothetical protein